MRNVALSLFFPLALVACSGSSISLEDDDAGPTAPAPSDTTTPPDGTNPPPLDPGNPDGPGDPGSPDGPNAPDASVHADAGAGDAGAMHDATTDAAPGPCTGTSEVEPNNSAATATVFTAGFCGAVATATDVDFFKVTLPATAKLIRASYTSTGPVEIRVLVRGQTIALGQSGPGAGAIPFFANETYVFEASSASKKAPTYALTLRTN